MDHFLDVVVEIELEALEHLDVRPASCVAPKLPEVLVAAAIPVPTSDVTEHLPMPHISFQREFVLLFKREWQQELPMILTRNQAVCHVGINIIAGVLFFGIASDVSERSLQERISLLFYVTTLFTFSPLYAALARMKERMLLATQELDKCLINPGPFVLASASVDALLHSLWPLVCALVCFGLADCARNLWAMLQMATIVVLCSLANNSVGVFLAILVPSLPAGMVLATFFAQTTLVAGGFYRTVPPILRWYGSFGVTKYAFEGLLLAELSWSDTYRCRPNEQTHLSAGLGSCFLESSRVIDDLRLRGIQVAKSPYNVSSGWSVAALVCYVVGSRFLALIVLHRRRSGMRRSNLPSRTMSRSIKQATHTDL